MAESNFVVTFTMFSMLLFFVISCIYRSHFSKTAVLRDKLLVDAQNYFDHDLPKSANILLMEVAALGQCNLRCKFLLGRVLNKNGNFVDGLSSCTEALPQTQNPSCNSAPIIQCQASSYIGLGNFSQAIPLVDRVLECQSSVNTSLTNSSGENILDIAYQQLAYISIEENKDQRYQEVVSAYAHHRHERYELTDNRLAGTYVTTLLERGGDDEKALLYITSRLRDSPDSTDVFMLETQYRLLMDRQQYRQSLDVSKQITALIETTLNRSTYNLGYRLQGQTLLALDRPQDAVDVLVHALSMNSTDIDTLSLLAYAFEAMGRDVDAEDMYSRAMKRKVERGETLEIKGLLNLGRMQMRLDMHDKALDTLRSGAEQCGVDTTSDVCSEMQLLLGEALYLSGETDSAVESLLVASNHPVFAELALHDLVLIGDGQPLEQLVAEVATEILTSVEVVETLDISSQEEANLEVDQKEVTSMVSEKEKDVETTADSPAPIVEKSPPDNIGDTLLSVSFNEAIPPVDVMELESDSTVINARDNTETVNFVSKEVETPIAIDERIGTVTSEPAVTITPITSAIPVNNATTTAATATSTTPDRTIAVAEQYLKLSMAYLERGLFVQALKETTKAARKAPRHARTFLLRAEILQASGQTVKAVDDLLFVWSDLQEQTAEVLVDITLCAEKLGVLGEHTHAARLLQAVDDSHRLMDKDSHLFLVKAYSNAGNYSAALTSLDRMHSLFSDNTEEGDSSPLTLSSVTLYADLYERSGRADQAVETWRLAVDRGVATHSDLGDVHLRQGHPSQAVQCYEKHLESLTLQDEDAVSPDVMLRNRALVAAVHKKIGTAYAAIATLLKSTSSHDLSVTAPSESADPVSSSAESRAAVQKAHTHFFDAMNRGVYDLDMRRFFASNPPPELAAVVIGGSVGGASGNKESTTENNTAHNKKAKPTGSMTSARRPRSVFKRVVSAVTEEVLSAAKEGELFQIDPQDGNRPLAAIPFSSGRHRWVVRRIVEKEEEERTPPASLKTEQTKVRRSIMSSRSSTTTSEPLDTATQQQGVVDSNEPELTAFEAQLRQHEAREEEEIREQKKQQNQ